MEITRLEEEQKKIKVYIDGEYAFLLYPKDIYKFKLSVGEELSQKLYDEILNDTIYFRAKQKALAILKFMDRTELELRQKLSVAGYNEDIIEKTIAYISSYGYINDERLASAYTRARKNSKSKLVIKTELIQKGIEKDIIDSIFQEEYDCKDQEDSEMIALKKAIAKKSSNPESLKYEEKQKLIASLYRKGFDIGKIKQILN